MAVDLVIGAPIHDRAWCLDTWFDAVEANANPSETGLCFVVPPADSATREVISRRGARFAFTEILRDRNSAYDREERRKDNHRSLALARNAILRVVAQVQPAHYLSWDSDLFISPGVLERMKSHQKPVMTVWTWLNRQPPKLVWHYPDFTKNPDHRIEVEAQEPMCATVMQWERPHVRAHHLDPANWDRYADGVWRADVALAFQLMQPTAYSRASYAANPYGEDIPFNWLLEQHGIDRWCFGDQPGVHLALEKPRAIDEIKLPYPNIMKLAEQKPLGATYQGDRPSELEAIGYFPVQRMEAGT